jgi:hypothetical protein
MLKVQEIKGIGCQHPPAPDVLLRHEFTLGLIAPKGAGKTTLILNLLRFYKNYFHRIIVFSPTCRQDDKWETLKKESLLLKNEPLEKFMEKIKKEPPAKRKKEERGFDRDSIFADIIQVPHKKTDTRELYYEGREKKERFTGKIKDEDFLEEYTPLDLQKILDEQQTTIHLLEGHGKSKHMADRILFVFDDLVGSNLFTQKRQDVFRGFNTRHRHFSASMLIVTQAYKEIPKTVRTQFSGLILFRIPNQKEILVIYEENPADMSYKQWMQAYHQATDEPYSFMFINYQPNPTLVMKNFDTVLQTPHETQDDQ